MGAKNKIKERGRKRERGGSEKELKVENGNKIRVEERSVITASQQPV